MVQFFEELEDVPILATVSIAGDLRIWRGGVVYTVIRFLPPNALARAQRIANVINEGGRADAAPVA